jgi:hypothetical protein
LATDRTVQPDLFDLGRGHSMLGEVANVGVIQVKIVSIVWMHHLPP